MEVGEFFPFIEIGRDSASISRWNFLCDIGARSSPDFVFFLDILDHIQEKSLETSSLPNHSRVLRLYLRLHAECLDSPNREIQKAKQFMITILMFRRHGCYPHT
ncbi:hypothetical protein F5Y11DRAFT_319867 [Daldinia sp. FL1419]|nr:hypothetical protein F5Y11DRAFT_319867 [Daldinia sp. FL1419]